MRRFIWPTVIVLAVALVVGLVATGGLGGRVSSGDSGGGMGGGSDGAIEPGVGAPDAVSEDAGGKGSLGGLDLGSIRLPSGPAIIKYGDLGVVVEVGEFDEALEEANAVAVRYGGFILGTEVTGGERRSGWITIRVRAADFDLAMRDLRDLGEVERESVSGQDVGMQVVDLQARLESWKTQREVLLRLLAQARSVADTLKIQVELQNVQMNIEQLTAELTYLEDQVALSTISVYLREPGASDVIDDEPRFSEAWERMVKAFLTVVFAMIVGLGYVIPIAIVLAAVVWAVRRYRRWRRA